MHVRELRTLQRLFVAARDFWHEESNIQVSRWTESAVARL